MIKKKILKIKSLTAINRQHVFVAVCMGVGSGYFHTQYWWSRRRLNHAIFLFLFFHWEPNQEPRKPKHF